MIYKIELTNKQKNTLECVLEIVRRHIGFNAKLEPVKTTNVEDTHEYQIGYKVGYEDCAKLYKQTAEEWESELEKAQSKAYDNGYGEGYEDGKMDATNTDMIDELKQVEYIRGYNTAINDYNKMTQWLHDCTDDFKEFMNKKYGYDIMYLTNPKVDEGVMLYDLICDHDIAEVISEFKKWYEEKKKAEEEIKVGDIVKFNEKCHSYNAKKDKEYLVLHIFDNGLVTIFYDNGDTGAAEISLLDKTGRHIDETEQLLDKLRGED